MALLRCRAFGSRPPYSLSKLLSPFNVSRAPSVYISRFDSSAASNQTVVKPWLDTNVAHETRVREILLAGRLHPADFFDSAVHSLLRDCGKLGTLQGMQSAEDILDKLYVEKRKLQNDQPEHEFAVPESIVCTVLYGWAQLARTNRVAMNRMRQLVDTSIDEAKHDLKLYKNAESEPTVNLYNTYLQGLANGSALLSQAAVNAEAVLYEMLQQHTTLNWHTQPNTRSYMLVIQALANTRHAHAGERAIKLLDTAWHIHDTAAAKSSSSSTKTVTPDAAMYSIAMKAVYPTKPERVTDLLEQAMRRNVPLDGGLFVRVFQAMARQQEMTRNAKKRIATALRAESMLKLMYETEVPIDSSKDEAFGINGVLDIWARAYCKEAAPRCEQFLSDCNADHLSVVSFNSCLYAWSKSIKYHPDAPERAEKLLEMQHSVAQRNPKVLPDFQSYTLCILTYSRSDYPDRLQHATRLLDSVLDRLAARTIALSGNPVAPFSAVLSAAATAATPEPTSSDDFASAVDTASDPYSIATQIYEDLKVDRNELGCTLDHHAVAAYLRCISQQDIGLDRKLVSKRVFHEATESGNVSRLVVEAYRQAMQNESEMRQKLPHHWIRNVPKEFR